MRDVKIRGAKGERVVKNALFDGGASHSFMHLDICKSIGTVIPFMDESGKKITKMVTLADGETKIPAIGTCTFDMKLNEIDIRDEAWVSDKLGREFIIGADTMQRYGILLKYAEKEKGGDEIVTNKGEEIAWL